MHGANWIESAKTQTGSAKHPATDLVDKTANRPSSSHFYGQLSAIDKHSGYR